MTIIDDYRAALAASDISDPAIVAKAVVDAVPAHRVRTALADALVALAPVMAASERAAIRSHARHPSPGSPRWQAAADGYNAAMLRMRLATPHGHIFLGDATIDDLRHQEEIRRSHAAATLAQAAWFARIATEMRHHHATVVRDLPAEVLAALEDAA